MARSFARSRRTGRKVWSGLTWTPSAETTTQRLVASFSQTVAPTTLLRVRGAYFVFAVPNAANDNDILAVGLIKVSTDAASAGGVSLPGPISDPEDDWIWHNYVPLAGSALTADDPQAIGLNVQGEIDSKAMRTFGPNDTIALIAELLTGEFASVSFTGGFRFLTLFG